MLHTARQRADRAARCQATDGTLGCQQPTVFACMSVGEVAVAPECLLARATSLEHSAKLATACKPEVEGRAYSLGRERQAVTRRVAREEDAVLDRGAQLVRDPVALVALRWQAEIPREPHGRLLDVIGGPERSDAHPQLIARGEVPRIARADIARVDPQLHLRPRASRVHLEPAREAVGRRLVG